MPRENRTTSDARPAQGVEVKPSRESATARDPSGRARRHHAPSAKGVLREVKRAARSIDTPEAEDRLRDAFGAMGAWAASKARRAANSRWTRWRVLTGAVMTLAAGFTVAALAAFSLAVSEPAWWGASGVDRVEAARVAEDVERGVSNALHLGRPLGEAWMVGIAQDDANAWIADRLPMWLANQGVRRPELLPEVRVAFDEGRIRIGFKRRDSERMATVSLRPRFDERGALWTPATGLSVGRLRLPSGMLRERGLDQVPDPYRESDGAKRAAATLSGEIPAPTELRLADGRVVRVTGVKVEEGRLVLTCVTVRR